MNTEQEQEYRRELEAYMSANPTVVHGSIVINNDHTLNDFYFASQTSFKQMIDDLVVSEVIPATTGDVSHDFSIYGFPRSLPNVTQVECLMLFVEHNKGTLGLRVLFKYKGSSYAIYNTSFIL